MPEKQELTDSFGRKISYLRISLTEICNFRCVYCTPASGVSTAPPCGYLTRAELVRLAGIAARLGIERVRLTGGEPLLRPDIVQIVRDLKEISELRDVSITTNGSRLKHLLRPLREAGLDRLNISLDSLDPVRFREVTGADVHQEVYDAAFAALAAGFPVKLNMVVMKSLTEQEIVNFITLARDWPLEVRFLEFMPLCGEGWRQDLVYPIQEVRSIARRHFELIEEIVRGDETAQVFQIAGGRGKVGFIAPLTEPFCNQCSRIRLTADGKIRPCLFSDAEFPVGPLLKSGAPDEEIAEALRRAVRMKPKGNMFMERPFEPEGRFELPAKGTPYIRNIGG